MQQKKRRTMHCCGRTIERSCPSPTHSITDSNDFLLCRRNYFVKMGDAEKEPANWNGQKLQTTFANALLDWKKDKLWNPGVLAKSNWEKLAGYVNQACSVNLSWDQYSSKYYRWKENWIAFKTLRGRCGSGETGIGWDDERLCFTAAAHQWAALCQENKMYRQFRNGKSCVIYLVLDEVFQASSAKGDNARSSASFDFEDLLGHSLSAGPGAREAAVGGSKALGKRSVSSRDDRSNDEFPRSAKSSKSGDLLQEFMSSVNRLLNIRIQMYEMRMSRSVPNVRAQPAHEESDPYSVERVTTAVNKVSKQVPFPVRARAMKILTHSRAECEQFLGWSGPVRKI